MLVIFRLSLVVSAILAQSFRTHLLGLLGAYFPLKKVLREYTPLKLTEEERKAVALEWLQKQANDFSF